MSLRKPLAFLAGILTLGLGFLPACSGGGGSSGAFGGFELISISVPEGDTWEINGAIDFTFSKPVDFSSISFNTISIKDTSSVPATGSFFVKTDPITGLPNPKIIVFQPTCPVQPDLSDAGFKPLGVTYEILVMGKDASFATVKSTTGDVVKTTQSRTFKTPNTTDPSVVFVDTAIGPPAFVPEETYIELGDGTRVDYVFTGSIHEIDPLGDPLPLNLYSDPASGVTIFLELNQAVDPSSDNITDEKVRIEFLDATGAWQPFTTVVELIRNCTETGATLKLSPLGILPQGNQIRVALVAGFQDLPQVDLVQADQTDFFAPTQAIAYVSLTPGDLGADEFFEDYLLSGTEPGSFEDTESEFDSPKAIWDNGVLMANFTFAGTGGPDTDLDGEGDFDWVVKAGTTEILDTISDQIIGGPGGNPVTSINVVNGVIDLRGVHVEPGATVRVQGPNPVTILATGDVIIEGVFDLSGFDAKPVGTLFTPNVAEPGAVGSAGGGRGGTGSPKTSASSEKGGNGFGAFGVPNAGGIGGEMGHSADSDKQKRRGAGGGGGRFGPDSGSFVAGDGAPGHPEGISCLSGVSPPLGGPAGVGPFTDPNPNNDFFGDMAIFDGGGALTDVVPGELPTKQAGAGGGAGGDSKQGLTCPTVPFGPPFFDKKGAGGGGGGGQIHIKALGRLVFGDSGTLDAGGGEGATGENVLGFDHIAGSSGGGSGGHVLVEADQVDFTNGGNPANPVRDYITTEGAAGGIGAAVLGYSKGGTGGPGIVQLHVPETNPALAVGKSSGFDIWIPTTALDLSSVTAPEALVMIPTFGARSQARSKWISLGGAAQNPGGGENSILFDFDGIDPAAGADEGKILTTGEIVDPHATLLPLAGPPEILGAAAPDPFVDIDGYTLVLSQPSLQPVIDDMSVPQADIFLRTPALLKNAVLRLEDAATGLTFTDFDITAATYDDAGVVLRITADPAGPSLATFLLSQGGPANVAYRVIKRFFRVSTGGVAGALPDTGFVRILFQAAAAGPDGLPDEANPVVDWTADISLFNGVAPGLLDFFRYEVEFDLAAGGASLTSESEAISLEFLRFPFSF